MDLDRMKQEAGQTLRWLADGWRHLSDKATNALTYFTPGKTEAREPGVRWGLLAADVSEHDDYMVVELEAPGLDKQDIDVSVEPGRLVVNGSKRYESERTSGTMRITERAFGQFRRVIPLPDEASTEGASATYERGVLAIRIPKAKPVSARRIKVIAR